MGVMPLPPAKNSSGAPSGSRSVKRPAGGSAAMRSPAARRSFSQLETRPSATRFTVTIGASPASGELLRE